MSRTTADWAALRGDILSRLDIPAEYAALGVEITGRTPSADGWLACRAFFRDDKRPSAAVNVVTGQYTDRGGAERAVGLFDFAAAAGEFSSWRAAQAYYAERAGVELPSGSDRSDRPTKPSKSKPAERKARPAAKAEFSAASAARPLPIGDTIGVLRHWASHIKPGISPASVLSAGGYVGSVAPCTALAILLPIYGADGRTVGLVVWDCTGGKSWNATDSSTKGWRGDTSRLEAAHTVHLCEGETDMLALAGVLPAGHAAVTNGGASNLLTDWQTKQLAGKSIIVWGDRDASKTGERGAESKARQVGGIVALPPGGVKDIREAIVRVFLTENTVRDIRTRPPKNTGKTQKREYNPCRGVKPLMSRKAGGETRAWGFPCGSRGCWHCGPQWESDRLEWFRMLIEQAASLYVAVTADSDRDRARIQKRVKRAGADFVGIPLDSCQRIWITTAPLDESTPLPQADAQQRLAEALAEARCLKDEDRTTDDGKKKQPRRVGASKAWQFKHKSQPKKESEWDYEGSLSHRTWSEIKEAAERHDKTARYVDTTSSECCFVSMRDEIGAENMKRELDVKVRAPKLLMAHKAGERTYVMKRSNAEAASAAA